MDVRTFRSELETLRKAVQERGNPESFESVDCTNCSQCMFFVPIALIVTDVITLFVVKGARIALNQPIALIVIRVRISWSAYAVYQVTILCTVKTAQNANTASVVLDWCAKNFTFSISPMTGRLISRSSMPSKQNSDSPEFWSEP